MNLRIIPRLEIKGPNLVKGIQFEGLRVLGNPRDFATLYYEAGADELIYIDIVASLYERSILPEVVRDTAKEVFIPLTVGGGIRTLDDIEALLNAGADKVAINTAAIKNPQMLSDAAKNFGSQCIVLAIEAKRMGDTYEPFAENGRQRTGKSVRDWAIQGQDLGVGEILLTSIDREGTHSGFDLNLIRSIQDELSIPLIFAGGAGKKEDVLSVAQQAKPDAICCSSLFHYHYLEYVLTHSEISRESIDFIRHQQSNYLLASARENFAPVGVDQLKSYLWNNSIPVRLPYSQP